MMEARELMLEIKKRTGQEVQIFLTPTQHNPADITRDKGTAWKEDPELMREERNLWSLRKLQEN